MYCTDTFIHICEYLRLTDVISIMAVCSRFRDDITDKENQFMLADRLYFVEDRESIRYMPKHITKFFVYDTDCLGGRCKNVTTLKIKKLMCVES